MIASRRWTGPGLAGGESEWSQPGEAEAAADGRDRLTVETLAKATGEALHGGAPHGGTAPEEGDTESLLKIFPIWPRGRT